MLFSRRNESQSRVLSVPMQVDNIVDTAIAHGHDKGPVVLVGSPWWESEANVGQQVVVEDRMDGLCVVLGSVLEAVDLVDGLVRGWGVICRHFFVEMSL